MGKFGTANIGRAINTYTDGEEITGYSRVTINVSDDTSYTAGDDTGRTLTLDNPWGSEAMAKNLLAMVKSSPYKPYDASGAVIDAAMELGDTVTVNGNRSRAYSLRTNFGGLVTAEVSAPGVEEMDEETPYKSTTERKIIRQTKQLRTEFQVVAGEIRATVADAVTGLESQIKQNEKSISAKVSNQGGNSSFGWELTNDSWVLTSNGGTVLKATKSGLELKGKITATGGKIGGFDIQSDYLSYNGQTWQGTKSKGAYLGTSGLQLGKNFRVDMQGNLYAKSGTFDGTVRARNIDYGETGGYFNGSGITAGSICGGSDGQIASNTIYGSNVYPNTLSSARLDDDVNAALGYAEDAHSIFLGVERAGFLYANSIGMPGGVFKLGTITYKDGNGNTMTANVVRWENNGADLIST